MLAHHLYLHLCLTPAPPLDAAALARLVADESAEVLALAADGTHAEVLLRLEPSASLLRLVRRIAGGDSVRGCELHSVSPRAVAIVRERLREVGLVAKRDDGGAAAR
jgi:hypothetical protein